LLVIASCISIVLLWLDARDSQEGARGRANADGSPEAWWLMGNSKPEGPKPEESMSTAGDRV
jgi:hypothetical protein